MGNALTNYLFDKSQIGMMQYKSIFQGENNGYNYQIISINLEFEKIIEKTKDEVEGQYLLDVLADKIDNSFDLQKELMPESFEENKKEFELKIKNEKSNAKIYNVKIFSPEENIYVAQFININKEKNILREILIRDKVLSNIIDSTNAGTWEWNVKTGEQKINKRWAEIIGYTIEELMPVSIETFKNLTHKEDAETVIKRFNGAKKNETNYFDVNFRMKHKNGSWVWINGRGLVISWDSQGKPLIISGTHVDITSIKLLEKEKEEKEVYYKRILNETKDAVVVLDSKGRISMWNRSAEILFGYKEAEVIGENAHMLLAPEKSKVHDFKNFNDMMEKEKDRFNNQIMEVTAKNKRGDFVPIEISISIIKQDEGYNAIGVMRDISIRKIEENKAKESQKILIEAQNMGKIGNWEMDIKSKKVTASKMAYNIYGIEKEIEEMDLEDIRKLVHPNDINMLEQALENLITKEEKYDVEFRIVNRKTSILLYVHSIAELVKDENGVPIKVRGIIQDITERKLREEQITYLSYYDQLTGLYNRRFFEEELRRLDTKRNLPITLVMGDVNGLKLVNDSFGHAMGDLYLKKIAKILKKACRSDDIVTRLSGDEFVIILPKAGKEEADQLIKRISKMTSNEKIGAINVSISFGAKTKKSEDEKIEKILKEAEDQMYTNKLYESLSTKNSTINIIMTTLYEKDEKEKLHSKMVGKLCKAIAVEMDFRQEEINKISLAGLMHDIGKIGIADEILSITGKLSPKELEQIRKHSETGYRILSSANEFSEIAQFILEHHERWDGKGYPKGLKKEQISIQARIIAVADAFDAMTRERTYKKVFSIKEAVEELKRCSRTQFDPEIVQIFIDKVIGKIEHKDLIYHK